MANKNNNKNNYIDLNSKRNINRGSKNNRYENEDKSKKKNTKLILINTITSVVLVLSLMIFSGSLYAYKGSALKPSDNSGELTPQVDEGQEISYIKPSADVTYILVVGTDESELLTDVMMLICFDTLANKASILQIPRDTYISDFDQTGKINGIYGQPRNGNTGIEQTSLAIREYFYLPVDYYFVVSLKAFREIVDAVGGVDIVLEEDMEVADFTTGEIYVLEAGPQNLNGVEAEGFIRDRNGYTDGDLGRERAQREFFASFANKMLSMSVAEMISVGKTCLKYVESNMSNNELLSYAMEARELSLNEIFIATLPGQSGYAAPNGGSYSYYSIHKDEYVELINNYFNPSGDPITEDDVNCPELFEYNRMPSEGEQGTFSDYLG